MNLGEKERARANLKRGAIAFAVVAYIAVAGAATLFGSAALVQLFHREEPHDLTVRSTYDAYQAAAGDPKERKKIAFAIGVPAALLFLVGPILLLGMTGTRRELYGSARWANPMEVKKSGLLDGKGIILGKYRGKFLMLGGAQSVMVCAPTRSGKGVSVAVPNLLAWPDSLVALDVKPELYRITGGYRAKHGQKVYVWAPFAEDGRTHCYNPLAYIRTDYRHVVGDTLAIAQIIYPAPPPNSASGSAVFFADTARNIFLGLALYLIETPEVPRTIGELLRQASGNGRPVKQYLQQLIADREKTDRPLSDKCVNALMRFLNTSDDVLTSILATLNAPLTVFEDALVDAATSKNDFLLTDLRRQRMSVYVCIPVNRLADAAVLLNLFYAQTINLNTDELPEHNPALKHQVLMVNDEFTTMGRVNAFSKGIGYIAGFGLRVLTIVQSRAQLESTYGKEDSRNFITNHAVELLFAPREQRDADEYSAALGHFTDKSESKGRSSSGKGGSSQSRNESAAKRPLLWPQEFKEIGQTKEVLIVENVKPIFADKICYWQDPIFTKRLVAAPVLPLIDLDTHRARIERRVRLAKPGELFVFEQLVADFSRMPPLSLASTAEEKSDYIAAFFKQLAVKPAEAPASASTSSPTSAPAPPEAITL